MSWTIEQFIPRRLGETVGQAIVVFGKGTTGEFRFSGSYNQDIPTTLVDMLTEAERNRQASLNHQPTAATDAVLAAFNANIVE